MSESTAVAGRNARWSDVFWVACWIALLAGFAEAAILAFRLLVQHHFIWSSKHFVWMAPASYLAFFAPPAAAAALAGRLWPRLVRPWWPRVVAGLGVFVAVACLLRMASLQRLHPVAIVVLAAGVAVQASRLFADPSGRTIVMVRRSTRWLAAAIVLLGGGTSAWWVFAERRAMAGLPAATAGAPNVLLLILDTVRAASLGLYGYGRGTTPELDAFARRGVVFDRAVSVAPWTLPSHAAMFTGRLPHDLSTGFLRPLDASAPTLAETLRDQGYLTAGFVANESYCSYQTGLNRGFLHYEDYPVTPKQILLGSELGQLITEWRSKLILRTGDAKPAALINGDFLAWLSKARDQTPGRPFFAFLNYMEAHLPYRSTRPGFDLRFRGSGNAKADRYDAAIASLDQDLGHLFRELESRGLLANTVVIIAADHGEQLGEHGLDDHGNSLYFQLLHVPFIIVGGSAPAGLRVTEPVSLRDLPATVLAFAGAPQRLQGQPLQRLWSGGTADSVLVAEVERHPTGLSMWPNRKGPMQAVLRGSWHYIRESDGREQLFDYWADPAEEHDVAGTPAGAAALPALRAARPHM